MQGQSKNKVQVSPSLNATPQPEKQCLIFKDPVHSDAILIQIPESYQQIPSKEQMENKGLGVNSLSFLKHGSNQYPQLRRKISHLFEKISRQIKKLKNVEGSQSNELSILVRELSMLINNPAVLSPFLNRESKYLEQLQGLFEQLRNHIKSCEDKASALYQRLRNRCQSYQGLQKIFNEMLLSEPENASLSFVCQQLYQIGGLSQFEEEYKKYQKTCEALENQQCLLEQKVFKEKYKPQEHQKREKLKEIPKSQSRLVQQRPQSSIDRDMSQGRTSGVQTFRYPIREREIDISVVKIKSSQSSYEEIYNYHLNNIQQENEGPDRERP